MAETSDLQAGEADQAVKTLEDRQKEVGMHVDVKLSDNLGSKQKLPEDVEEKENISLNHSHHDDNDRTMQDEGNGSPTSSGEQSLIESPCPKNDDSKNSSDSTPKDNEDTSSCPNGSKRKRRPNRHKGGKNHRKQWKPYSKLSWDEKKKRDDKETVRANKKRDDRFASGLPMAPYNTTQFIMEDQDQPSPQATPAVGPVPVQTEEEKERSANRDDAASGSYDSSDGEYYDSPDDEDIFMEKEFSEAYESFHTERLQELTKEELVKEYIELEAKNETLEKTVKDMKHVDRRRSSEESVEASELAKLKEEMKKTREENAKLHRENEFLKVAAGKLSVK